MNKDKQRIAIAEACGWEHWKAANTPMVYLRKPKDDKTRAHWIKCGDSVRPDLPVNGLVHDIPNYCADLNAMTDALKSRPSCDCDFVHALAKVVGADMAVRSFMDIAQIANATAAQRAEAFLKAIGKWEDGE